MFQRLLIVCGLLVALVCGGCKCQKPPLATLREAHATVQRDFAVAVDVWQTAAIGATFEFGDAVRTGEAATALIVFDDDAKLRLEPETTVRFLREPHRDGATLNLERGSVVVEAGKAGINLQTQLGPAVIRPGAIVHAVRKEGRLNLLVEIGVAELDPGGANERTLPVGQFIEIAIGAAVVDAVEPVAAAGKPSASVVPSSTVVMEELRVLARVDKGSAVVTHNGKSSPLGAGPEVVEPGSTLRLKASARVTVSQGERRITLEGPGVYTIGAGQELVRTDAGTLTLRGASAAIALPGGMVEAIGSAPTWIEVTRQGQSTDVFVRAGRASVKQGERIVDLQAGRGAHMDGREVTLRGDGVPYRDLSTNVGGSLVFHNSAPPTSVGFEFAGKCEHLGVIEVLIGGKVSTWASGKTSANIELPTGVHSYRLRCLAVDGAWSEPGVGGRVTGYGDSAAAQLPSYAPSNVVNADGRKYTLLYQNRLPSITVQWPDAPPADSYTLTHSGDGGTNTMTTSAPRHVFASGALGEGQHTFQFRSALGRTSRKAAATIVFDNAAPKASISSPANGGFAPNTEVEVRGIALPGWDVLAQGQPLTTDAQGRFSGRVLASGRGVLLTFTHPKRGVHYYIRRAK